MVRTIWHHFLMAAVCSLLITAVQLHSLSDGIGAATASFKAVFGGVNYAPNAWWTPERNPLEPRSMLLPHDGVLIYAPSGEKLTSPEDYGVKKYQYAVYWFPGHLAMVNHVPDGQSMAVAAAVRTDRGFWKKLDPAKLQTELKALADDPKAAAMVATDQVRKLSAEELRAVVFIQLALVFGGTYLAAAFLLMLLYLFSFVAIFYLTGSRRTKFFTLRELMTAAVYAGLPVMPVAALFAAFELPLLDFGSAYVLGTIIYLMIVLGKLMRDSIGQEIQS